MKDLAERCLSKGTNRTAMIITHLLKIRDEEHPVPEVEMYV